MKRLLVGLVMAAASLDCLVITDEAKLRALRATAK